MIIFGWCNDGNHKGCIQRYQRFVVNEKITKRNPQKYTMLDEWRECECPCHSDDDVVDSDNKPKRKRKK